MVNVGGEPVSSSLLMSPSQMLFFPTERVVGDGERMMEVLQQWGQHRGEVRYLLHHQRAPGREAGETTSVQPSC